MILEIIAFSCPLLLAATGALFSEYCGVLALFLDGLISFSGYLTYTFTVLTGSPVLGILLSTLISTILTLGFAVIVEKFKANYFIAAIGMNLFFASIISLLSSLTFGTRGVLSSQAFRFSPGQVTAYSIIITIILILAAAYMLIFTQKGIYFRICGNDQDVLTVKGIFPSTYRIASWTIAAFFASQAGSLLAMRISSYVPNLASGKGWMALAAVYLGKKKIWLVVTCAIIFCATDYFSANIQNYVQGVPSSVLLALPYLIALLITVF